MEPKVPSPTSKGAFLSPGRWSWAMGAGAPSLCSPARAMGRLRWRGVVLVFGVTDPHHLAGRVSEQRESSFTGNDPEPFTGPKAPEAGKRAREKTANQASPSSLWPRLG